METQAGYYETIVREFFPSAILETEEFLSRAYVPGVTSGSYCKKRSWAWRSLWRRLRALELVPTMEERQPW